MGSKGHFNSLDSCSMEMRSLMFVLIGLSVAHVKGVDILRMDERIYEGEEVEMIETEMDMDEGDTVDFEIDEDAACKSCCDPAVVDICGELTKKLDEIDIDMAGIGGCPEGGYINYDEDCKVVAEEAIPECMERMAGTEDVGDRTKMKICLREITEDFVHFDDDEVDSGSTLQGCMCQGFLANRKTLEDASKLLCSNNRNAKSSHPITHNPPIAIADDVPVSSSLYDDVLLWGLLYQGYYQGAWQSRNFGFHPKVPLKPREKVGMFTRGGYRHLHQQHY